MPDPTLDQMIEALDKRRAIQAQGQQPQGWMDLVRSLIMPKRVDPVMPRFDAQGNQADPRTINELLFQKRN